METNDQENNPQPPLDTPPAIDYNTHLEEDTWSGIMYVKNSPLMTLLPKVVPSIPGEVNRQMAKTHLDKWHKSGSEWGKSRRLARSAHAQAAAIVSKNRDVIVLQFQAESQEGRMRKELFDQLVKDLGEALRFAKLIEAECEKRAHAKRVKKEAGNITWLTVSKKGGP